IGSPAVATDIMGLEQADIFVRLLPKAEWRSGRVRADVIADLERAVQRVDPDLELAFTQPIQMRFNELLGGAVADVSVSVFGDDLRELHRIAGEARRHIAQIPGARDVRVLAPEDVPLLQITPHYAAASALDLGPRDVLDAVAALRTGLPVATTFDGPLRIPIVLRTPGVDSPLAIGGGLISNPSGGLVPLASVAQIQRHSVPSLVQRFDGQRRLMLGFNVRGVDLGTVTARAQAELAANLPLPRGYRFEWGGQAATLADATRRLAVVIPLVLALIVGLMFSVFRSGRTVTVLLLHIPFACAGGIAILHARGLPLSVSAAIGFIALSGIAVMNGMVLLTELRRYEQLGMPAAEAALRAARDRARPVIMTALVAALGFVPMVVATGVGAEVQRPLASVVVFGLITATGTTLVVMPALYPWLSARRPRAVVQRARVLLHAEDRPHPRS
ncbi:MAG TPA: efflux RND transporter permease subunit, partial [Polyangiales bacterium]|nr:efflux RND transporter permease subunit [Polyangiales bacterium]